MTDTSPAPAARQRLVDLDRCKGAAIILVVFGHLISRGTPEGYEWYGVLKRVIYDFHMPLFMYLSGYVFFYSDSHERTADRYKRLLSSRAERLLLPFLAVGILIVVGKYLSQFVVSVDEAPRSLLSGLANLFLDTKHSPALSIWYVFVLFIFSALTPLLWRVVGARLFWIIPAAAALSLVPLTDDFYFDRVVRFAPFFLIGGLAAGLGDRWLKIVDRFKWLFLAAFLASFVLLALDVDWRVRLIVTGALSLPAVHGLMRAWRRDQVLLWFAANAFIIYLINTIFIGAAKGVIGKLFGFEGWVIGAALPVLFAVGVLGPVATRELVLKRFAWLYKITA